MDSKFSMIDWLILKLLLFSERYVGYWNLMLDGKFCMIDGLIFNLIK